MKVIAFNGSPNHDGNTNAMLRIVLHELQGEGIETELIHIGGKPLHGCTACGRCFEKRDQRCVLTGDGINEWIAKIVSAQAVLLGSPTYFADVTPEMKAFIDRVGMVSKANGELLARKPGAAVVAVRRGGSIHAFDTMNHLFLISQMIVVGSSYWNMAFGMRPGEIEADEEGVSTMKTLGRNMAWLLRILNGNLSSSRSSAGTPISG